MKPKAAGRRDSKSAARHARPWIFCAALCLLALIAYANSFDSGFVLDNRDLVLSDSRVHEATPGNLTRIVNQSYWGPAAAAGLYRPVTTLSFLVDYAILGNTDHPAGYHWTNLLLHTLNVLLLFALARRLIRDLWPSFLIAALWAVHPVLTESVTDIAGRADLLAGMTTLGGLLIYLRSAEAQGRQRVGWLVALAAVTAVGVFSKESAVAVAGVIALYELTWWNPGRLRALLLGWLAMLPAFLAMFWMRSRVLGAEPAADFPFVDNPIVAAGFRTARLTAVKVIAKYLGLLVWPANLSFDYSYAQIPLADGRHLLDWIAWAVVLAAAIGTALLYRRNKPAFFASGFAFLTLLPASNLVVPIGTIMAERFLYLPAAGFAVCLTLALYSIALQLKIPRAAPLIVGLLIVTAFVARTWARNDDWRDDGTVAAAAVRASPESFKTHMWAGAAAARAQPGPAGVEGALAETEKALAIVEPLPDRENDAAIFFRAGVVYLIAGNTLAPRDAPEARSTYEKARTLLTRARTILRLRGQDNAARTPWLPTLDMALAEVDQRLGAP